MMMGAACDHWKTCAFLWSDCTVRQPREKVLLFNCDLFGGGGAAKVRVRFRVMVWLEGGQGKVKEPRH